MPCGCLRLTTLPTKHTDVCATGSAAAVLSCCASGRMWIAPMPMHRARALLQKSFDKYDHSTSITLVKKFMHSLGETSDPESVLFCRPLKAVGIDGVKRLSKSPPLRAAADGPSLDSPLFLEHRHGQPVVLAQTDSDRMRTLCSCRSGSRHAAVCASTARQSVLDAEPEHRVPYIFFPIPIQSAVLQYGHP